MAAAVRIGMGGMPGYRIQRVNEQLKREISEIVMSEVRDPRVGAVAVTAVTTAPDLTLARVFVQALGTDAEKKDTLKGLKAAGSFIRLELGRRLDLRRVPELRFELDRSTERALRIEELLAEAAPPDEPDQDPDAGG